MLAILCFPRLWRCSQGGQRVPFTFCTCGWCLLLVCAGESSMPPSLLEYAPASSSQHCLCSISTNSERSSKRNMIRRRHCSVPPIIWDYCQQFSTLLKSRNEFAVPHSWLVG